MTYMISAMSEVELAYDRKEAFRIARLFSNRSEHPVTVQVNGNFGAQCIVAVYRSGVATSRPLSESKIIAELGDA